MQILVRLVWGGTEDSPCLTTSQFDADAAGLGTTLRVRIYNDQTHTASLWPHGDGDAGLLTLPLVFFQQCRTDFNKVTTKFIIQTKIYVQYILLNAKGGTINNYQA